MKKALLLLMTGILTLGILSGCSKTDKPPVVSPTPSVAVPEASAKPTDDAASFDKLIALIGKEDADVVSAFGKGTANIPEGSDKPVSREFKLSLLGEDVLVVVNFDDNQKVGGASVTLGDREVTAYEKDLSAIFGAGKSDGSENEEGSGRTAYVWEKGTASITLLRAYDMNTIEIAPIA
ncbi:MAG: hypothetical protein RRY47_06920 [Oscillospiraceae bacterium]